VGPFEIFVIRALLSGMFATLISRFFFKDLQVIKVLGLAVLMLGLSYVLEYLRRRNREGDHES